MRIIDIPYLNMTGPDCKWTNFLFWTVSAYTPSSSYFIHFPATFAWWVCFLPQCDLSGTMFSTSPSLKNGKPATSTSSSVPSVKHIHSVHIYAMQAGPPLLAFDLPPPPPPGNIQVSWIDDTSAFVSLSQTDQVQIGEDPTILIPHFYKLLIQCKKCYCR